MFLSQYIISDERAETLVSPVPQLKDCRKNAGKNGACRSVKGSCAWLDDEAHDVALGTLLK